MMERRGEAGDVGRGHTRKICDAVTACSLVLRAMTNPDAFHLTGWGRSRMGVGERGTWKTLRLERRRPVQHSK